MMKKAIYTLFLASLVVSCTENLEDKSVRCSYLGGYLVYDVGRRRAKSLLGI